MSQPGSKLHAYKGEGTSVRARCGALASTNPGRVLTLKEFSAKWPRHIERCKLCVRSAAKESR